MSNFPPEKSILTYRRVNDRFDMTLALKMALNAYKTWLFK